MTKSLASGLLTLALLSTPLVAHAAPAATPQLTPAAMTMGTANTPGDSGTKPIIVGVGAVLGYALMMNPYGTAVMGAAMGAMLAAEFYETYNAAPANAAR